MRAGGLTTIRVIQNIRVIRGKKCRVLRGRPRCPLPQDPHPRCLLPPPLLDALGHPADQGGIVAQDLADLLPLRVIAQSICKPFQPVLQIGQRNGLLFHRGPDLESLQKGQHIIDLPAHYP